MSTLAALTITYSAPSRESTLISKHENLKLFVDVLEEVQDKYVKKLDDKKMRELVETMITSGLERLDPHSSFYNDSEYRQLRSQSRGRFGGIGIRIGLDRAGQILVESPMVGTPAYEAGVQAGDLIVKINDQSTENMPLKKVVETIQGEPGTKVKLSVLHEGSKEPVELEITRAEIKVDSVLGDTRMKDRLEEWNFWVDAERKIAYVRVTAFTETTTDELVKVVTGLQKAGMRGLIVDLRNNPGGLLKSAIEVSSLFLPEGKTVVTTKSRTREEPYFVKNNPQVQPNNFPIAILVNRFSASASEIVAAALQDYGRAIIIGERTYGKGSVQNIIPMEGDASALKLTTALYWRPSMQNIHRFPEMKDEEVWGVKPNQGYEVKLTTEEQSKYFKWRRERDIIRKAGQEPKEDKELAEFKDRVLEKALEHIRGELDKQGRNVAPPPPQAQAVPAEPTLPRSYRRDPLDVRYRADAVRLSREGQDLR
jgi:carboxyl-terminal processing protease